MCRILQPKIWTEYLGTGDGAKCRELLAKHLVVNSVVQVLDVQVHALVAIDSLHLQPLKLLFELCVTFRLLLRTSDKEDMPVHLFVIQLIHRLSHIDKTTHFTTPYIQHPTHIQIGNAYRPNSNEVS